MSEISKAYEPQSVEEKWYKFWLDRNCFTANPHSPKPAYSIVIPPPNVTGVLHLGHVLNNTIQDILARKARMDGKEVLWLPGTDHAGIATQTVVERTLKKSGQIKHRDDLGREKFLEHVWQWKQTNGDIIVQQLKKLGVSCDWTRERFTMDPEYSRCVQKVFVDLYKKGLIYQGKRMVNWCPASLTALSDEEVVMKEQKGFLYYFKVEIAEEPGTFLTIATTRPETIPGDTAVAVNPKDPRYAKYIGKHVVRPLPSELPREQKLIPIIGDEHVDFEFGTGVLKVTPAHDKADFEIIGRQIRHWNEKHPIQVLRHNATVAEAEEFNKFTKDFLQREHLMKTPEVINERGIMTSIAGESLVGLDRFKARKVVVEKLVELGALDKEEPYTNKVGFSERADVPIEPRLSEQWFLKYPSTEKSRSVVANGELKFHPERWAKVYDHWMSGIQDWCISRQLWWGHRIPVWSGIWNPKHYEGSIPHEEATKLSAWLAKRPSNLSELKSNPGVEVSLSGKDGHTTFIRFPNEKFSWDVVKGCLVKAATVSEDEAQKLEQLGLTQDPDVLDTWFSSWLWPFATMGWPEKTDTLKKFYPTTDLVTGPDIIFFWVARMIMAGYEYMEDMPFQNVYFTGIIRDKQGRKMSKSLGNSPDPLNLMKDYGADALRFGVMRSAPLGQDVLFDEQQVELGRNFCNKLWNACRFRQMQAGEVQGEIEPTLLSSDDKWILLKLDAAIREVTIALNEYKFSDATAAFYRFFWSEYCDWYVEASKTIFFGTDAARKANALAVMDFVLSHTLRLFHPFIPFITEELWHGMDYSTDMPENRGGETIVFAPWPKPLENYFIESYLDTNIETPSAEPAQMSEPNALVEKLSGETTQINEPNALMGKLPKEIARINERNALIVQARHLRSEYRVPQNRQVRFVLWSSSNPFTNYDMEIMRRFTNASSFEFTLQNTFKDGTPVCYLGFGGKLFMPLEGVIDVKAETARLKKDLEKIELEISKVEQKLNNPAFAQKVPPAVLEEHKQRLINWQTKRAQLQSALDALQG